MSFNFNNETPIYLQIIEDIKLQIINKIYKPNDKIPSVRELSLLYGVNPNTIMKALTELESLGLVYTERTNGKFVTDNENIINEAKSQTVNDMIDKFYSSMEGLGLSKKEILDILRNKE